MRLMRDCATLSESLLIVICTVLVASEFIHDYSVQKALVGDSWKLDKALKIGINVREMAMKDAAFYLI